MGAGGCSLLAGGANKKTRREKLCGLGFWLREDRQPISSQYTIGFTGPILLPDSRLGSRLGLDAANDFYDPKARQEFLISRNP